MGPEQGSQCCFADVTNWGLITSVMQPAAAAADDDDDGYGSHEGWILTWIL